MGTLSQRIDALESLGHYLSNFDENIPEYFPFVNAIEKATLENGWFRKEECIYAISCWGKALEKEKIRKWLDPYALTENQFPKTIALVLAGNLPLVGLHDIIAVWITGNTALIKCATKDKVLIPFIVNNTPLFKSMSLFTVEKLKDFDAVIATGSNNSARYFDYYFAKFPSLIRKNRNGVAVLNGRESRAELESLGSDMLQYFGLGCRSVAKLYLPLGYDLNKIFGGIYPFSSLIEVNKYANNYEYNKAVFLISEFDFSDNGFFLLKEDSAISSPIACAFYEYYDDTEILKDQLIKKKDNIQCIVTNESYPNAVSFGQTQMPGLGDYADGVDTIQFLSSLSN